MGECDDVDCIHLGQDWDRNRAVVITVMNFRDQWQRISRPSELLKKGCATWSYSDVWFWTVATKSDMKVESVCLSGV